MYFAKSKGVKIPSITLSVFRFILYLKPAIDFQIMRAEGDLKRERVREILYNGHIIKFFVSENKRY